MHLKRKWLFISLLAVVVLLVIGIVGGTVYAQSNSTLTDKQNTFIARVAEILGIDQSKVESAFNQAAQEMRDEAMNARLQQMIENGKLTQEQADQYKTWLKSRPNLPAELGAPNPFGGRGCMGGCFPGMGGRGFDRNFAPNSSGSN